MANASILIVDDDEHVRAVLHELLTEVGYHAATAADGQAAVREAESGHFDVILIDVHMPERDGVQVLRDLRTATPDSRCVMISGVRDAALAETCQRIGAEGFLYKPLRLADVTGLIDELVKPPVGAFSWDEEAKADAVPALVEEEPVAEAEPEEPVAVPRQPEVPREKGTRLRDPVAMLRCPESEEVLARVACTVYAELDADRRSARQWRGVVDDYHFPPGDGAPADETLSGTLVLRDAVRGLFTGPATLRGNEIAAAGPLQHTPPITRQRCTITTRKAAKDPSVTILDLEGDLSGEYLEQFSEALRHAMRAGRRLLVVQFDGVSVLDSAAVKTCLWIVPQLRGRKGDLRIAGAKGDIWRTIEALGAHRTISCYATEADAVASFSGSRSGT